MKGIDDFYPFYQKKYLIKSTISFETNYSSMKTKPQKVFSREETLPKLLKVLGPLNCFCNFFRQNWENRMLSWMQNLLMQKV